MDNTLLDGCFSGWQPYGCSKENKSYYKLTSVYKINSQNNYEKISEKLFNDTYTNSLSIMKTLSMRGHLKKNIQYSDELNTMIENKLKKTNSNTNNSMVNDIYGGNNVYFVDHNDVINPYELVEKNEKELIKGS